MKLKNNLMLLPHTTKRIAVCTDIHGCLDEFNLLTKKLEHESIDSIWHCGDLVDRGPDSGGVVKKCEEEGIEGVLGNHESTIITIFKSVMDGKRTASPDKTNTCKQLGESGFKHISKLPLMHVFDDLKVVLVHAGLEPRLPAWKTNLPMHHFFGSQTHAVCHTQLVHPEHPGKTRWWGYDPKNECTEEDNRKEGWVRWYELYQEDYLCVYGHSIFFNEPFRYGQTLGIDTGCVFGGMLTAVILPEGKIVQVKAKKAYCERKLNSPTPYNTDP